MKKPLRLLFFLLTLLPRLSLAQDIKIVERAQDGNPQAQFELGLQYYSGLGGVPKDYQKAFEWWEKSAKQGHAKAQNNLAVMYRKGNGVAQDYQKAFKWFQKAASQGYAIAQKNLLDWWQREAQAGNVAAQFNLGTLYHRGASVPKDFTKAYTWYAISALNGDKDGGKWRDYMFNKLTAKELETAQKFIKQWTKTYRPWRQNEQK